MEFLTHVLVETRLESSLEMGSIFGFYWYIGIDQKVLTKRCYIPQASRQLHMKAQWSKSSQLFTANLACAIS